MNLIDWFPAATTSGLLAVALWLGRHLILTRLTKSVEYEFSKKIEDVRTQLREGEERLKADLRAKEAEIAALRSGALSALASRQVVLDKRRLEAVDQLWSAVMNLASARRISGCIALTDYEKTAQAAERDPWIREFFKMVGGEFDMKNLKPEGAAKARPFVSPMAWVIYEAMQAITTNAVVRLQVLKAGLGVMDLVDHNLITMLLKAILPHRAGLIDQYGPQIYHSLLEELDEKLINEFQAMLAGVEADKASVKHAAEISKLARELLNKTLQPQPPSCPV
jgi:hypothetical protein